MCISVFWSHERLSDRSIKRLSQEWCYSQCRSRCHSMSLKNFNIKSVLCSWHRIPLVIWNHSAWVFYRWVVAWSLNGHSAAYRPGLKKCSTCEYESSYVLLDNGSFNTVFSKINLDVTYHVVAKLKLCRKKLLICTLNKSGCFMYILPLVAPRPRALQWYKKRHNMWPNAS